MIPGQETIENAQRELEKFRQRVDPLSTIARKAQNVTEQLKLLDPLKMAAETSGMFKTLRNLQECRANLPRLMEVNFLSSPRFKELQERCNTLSDLPPLFPRRLTDEVQHLAQEVKRIKDEGDTLSSGEIRARVENLEESFDKTINETKDVVAEKLDSLQAVFVQARAEQSNDFSNLLRAISALKTVAEKEAETAKRRLHQAHAQSKSADCKANTAIFVTLLSTIATLVVSITSCCVSHNDARRARDNDRRMAQNVVGASESVMTVTNAISGQTRELLSGMMGLRKAMPKTRINSGK